MIFLIDSEFKINWGSLVTLVVGMVLGVVLFLLIYTLATLKQLKKTKYTVTEKVKDVEYKEVEEEISKFQKEFLIRKDEEKQISFANIRDNIYQLMKNIASKFYPDSKEPLSELTLEELILLDNYIISKIEELLDTHRLLSPLRKMKLSSIIAMINAKNAVTNNKVVKKVHKSGIGKILSATYTVLNAVNPATWIKKAFVNPAIEIITKQICLTTIKLIGQETYHVYSKQAFLEPIKDQELEKILKEMEEDEIPQIQNKKG